MEHSLVLLLQEDGTARSSKTKVSLKDQSTPRDGAGQKRTPQMNDAEKSARPVSRESTRAIREDVKKHVRLEAELASCLQAALAAQRLDERLARVLEARCSATREGMALIFRWLDQIDRRIGQAETRICRM